MIPQSQVQGTLLTAQLKAANMTLANITVLQGGQLYVDWYPVTKAQRGINAVGRQYALGDYSSLEFLTAYACLQGFVGTYGGGTIDPNAQNPGITIEVTGDIEPQIITQIIGGVTDNPITVPYNGFTNPTLIYRNADGSNYNGAVNNIDTGSAIILTGDSNDGVTFADSFEFVIKQ